VSARAEITTTSGRGIGLGAARDACERLGGYVTLDTERGKGTRFRFHLPVPERGASLRPPTPGAHSLANMPAVFLLPDGGVASHPSLPAAGSTAVTWRPPRRNGAALSIHDNRQEEP